MRNIKRTAWTRILFVALSCPAMSLAGCSKKAAEPESITLEGKIESIERSSDKTGTITVRYYNDKHKQEMLGTGRVTEDTEVLIDGVVATLADIHEGDQVRGDVRIEKKGDKRVQTATRIRVDRPRPAGGD